MRPHTLLALPLLALVLSSWAQSPPALEPVPDAAPAAPSSTITSAPVSGDEELEGGGIVITRPNGDKVQEFRTAGKIYMIKVTPPHGVPYYLVDEKGDGTFIRQGSLDHGIRPPMWVIHSF